MTTHFLQAELLPVTGQWVCYVRVPDDAHVEVRN